MNITEKVIDIVTQEQGLPPGVVTADSTFAELGIDSHDGLNILFVIEREFQVDIPDPVAKTVTDVARIIEILTSIIEGKNRD